MALDAPHFYVGENIDQIDTAAICEWIRGSHWGHWQSEQQIMSALENSLLFGVFEPASKGELLDQIRGFARVVTDHATFSCLTDLYISAPYRGRGLGRMLMGAVCAHPSVASTICILGTRDAQEFYKKFKFKSVDVAVMQRDPRS